MWFKKQLQSRRSFDETMHLRRKLVLKSFDCLGVARLHKRNRYRVARRRLPALGCREMKVAVATGGGLDLEGKAGASSRRRRRIMNGGVFRLVQRCKCRLPCA